MMKNFSSPFDIFRKPPLANWMTWLRLAEVGLFTLVAGSAGFAVAWLVVSDKAILQVHPESLAAPDLPADEAEPATTLCTEASFTRATTFRNCISVN